jgi:adenine-specific DNA-methyltransferase
MNRIIHGDCREVLKNAPRVNHRAAHPRGIIDPDVIIHGDCREVLRTLPSECVDFVLTDPPYFVRYRDRSGREVKNDRNEDIANVLAAFPEIYRVLKPNALCVSFYGFQAIDAFMAAWKSAGFTPVDHIVWRKTYASSARFCKRFHEQAYVLAKGRPSRPSKPLDDVQPWAYSGNRSHPTEKDVRVLQPVIQAFTQPGALVLDPFSGSGSTSVAAALAKRRYIGIELEQRYCQVAKKRLAGVARHMARGP